LDQISLQLRLVGGERAINIHRLVCQQHWQISNWIGPIYW
jgi:hypothetical protein